MRTLMLQTWENLTFLHWPVPAAALRPLVPPELEIDTFDGTAWISLVPFLIRNLRPPRTKAIPWLGTFAETNVRTYVTDRKGGSGVWFFSLDADRCLAVIGARAGFFLPYFWARMRIDGTHYTSVRKGAMSDIHILPGDPIEHVNERDRFLTNRMRFYTKCAGRILYGPIEHPPWPLHSARIDHLEETLLQAAGIQRPNDPPIVHYSPTIDVQFDYLKRA